VLRREVEKREASLQVARLALQEAERRLQASDTSAKLPQEAYDPQYGFNRRYVGLYTDAPTGDSELPPIPQSAFASALCCCE
jgi:hypothetical protein